MHRRLHRLIVQRRCTVRHRQHTPSGPRAAGGRSGGARSAHAEMYRPGPQSRQHPDPFGPHTQRCTGPRVAYTGWGCPLRTRRDAPPIAVDLSTVTGSTPHTPTEMNRRPHWRRSVCSGPLRTRRDAPPEITEPMLERVPTPHTQRCTDLRGSPQRFQCAHSAHAEMRRRRQGASPSGPESTPHERRCTNLAKRLPMTFVIRAAHAEMHRHPRTAPLVIRNSAHAEMYR